MDYGINGDIPILGSGKKLNDLIIESGANSFGDWIKFSDGNMICTGSGKVTGVNVINPYGAFYYGGFEVQTPQGFTKINYCNFSMANIYPQLNWIMYSKGYSNRAECTVMDITTRKNSTIDYQFMIIGKWK